MAVARRCREFFTEVFAAITANTSTGRYSVKRQRGICHKMTEREGMKKHNRR